MDLLSSLQPAARNFFNKPKAKKADKGSLQAGENHRVIFWSQKAVAGLKRELKKLVADWQIAQLADLAIQKFSTENEIVWILRPDHYDGLPETKGHNSRLVTSKQGRARELCGYWFRMQKPLGKIEFEFAESVDEEIVGALIGLGLANYRFLDAVRDKDAQTNWSFSHAGKPLKPNLFDQAVAIYSGMNLARHLTNMPAAAATPAALAEKIAGFLKNRKNLKIEIWNVERLKKEKMGLLLGVGAGSATGARLLHLKYRPAKSGKKPVAFVGKGVTFDTGGLDIKPSAGMRLMKKDMAGAAILAGVCHFVTALNLKTPCDFYLPFAENAVSDRATRPGDVHVAHSGHLVEIDNTDAEGRLVMADAIHLAVTKKGPDAPAALIDVSTLTGAMRVAVGLDVAGYFSNDDRLAREIESAAQNFGEYVWRMPLVQKYNRQLTSSFADFKNSSESGFGGAITAALFLEKFVGDTPWVHFDMMAWATSADGALNEGANAQGFQTLASFLLGRE